MPPLSASRRPQTLKQARKAFQKTGKSPRLTASEIAAAERRALLQQRADRIKEREARRKANLRKREEKIAKEKELAAKLGKPFDNGKHWHIGPSQLNLGRFFGGVDAQEKKPEAQAAQDFLQAQPSLNIEEQRPVLPPESMPPPPRPMTKAPGGDLENAEPSVASKRACKLDEGPNESCDTEIANLEEFFDSNTQIAVELSTPAHIASVRSDKLQRPKSSPPQPPPSVTPRCPDEAYKPKSDEAVDLLELFSTQDFDSPFEPTQQPPTKREALSDAKAAPSLNQDPNFQLSPLLPDTDNDDDRGGLNGDVWTQNTRWIPSNPKMPSKAMSTSSFSEDDLTDHDLRHLALKVESQITSSTGGIKS